MAFIKTKEMEKKITKAPIQAQIAYD